MKKIVKTVIAMLILVVISGINAYGEWDQAIYDTSVDSAEYENVGEICESTIIEQEFTVKYNGMRGLSIKFATWERKNDSKLQYSIIDKENNLTVAEGKISLESLVNNDYNQISFPEIKESKGKKYILRIKDEDVQEGKGVTIFTTKKDEGTGKLCINDKTSEKALVIKVIAHEFNVEHFVVFIGLILYIIGFVKLLYKFLR